MQGFFVRQLLAEVVERLRVAGFTIQDKGFRFMIQGQVLRVQGSIPGLLGRPACSGPRCSHSCCSRSRCPQSVGTSACSTSQRRVGEPGSDDQLLLCDMVIESHTSGTNSSMARFTWVFVNTCDGNELNNDCALSTANKWHPLKRAPRASNKGESN